MVGQFTGSKRAAFPFSLASQDGQTIYSTESVPKDFKLGDPDHLTGSQINLLYHHWLGRQQKGLLPFEIINPGPNHEAAVKKMSAKTKGKQKLRYLDVSTDEDKDEDEDENTESDREDLRGGAMDSDEEEMALPPKIGPPIRRGKKNQSSTLQSNDAPQVTSSSKVDKHPAPVAGSSKLSPEKIPKKRKEKESKVGEAAA
jgi:hypothetical protein